MAADRGVLVWGLVMVIAGVTAGLALPVTAGAELKLPPGFAAQVYVSGEGFDGGSSGAGRGFPSSSTLTFDGSGTLYLARTGRRYQSGAEVEDLWQLYRIPLGGARLTPNIEKRYLFGPPLPNPVVAGMRGGRELLVTTYDRERKVGVLYRLVDGAVEMFAGGTPPRGTPPALVQPEGAAVDAAGHVYVADRARGTIVKFDRAGRVVDPRWLVVARPRAVAMDEDGALWVGSDGPADAPWQRGPGEIWRVSPEREPRVVVQGPIAAGIAVGPGGQLFVADRQAAKVVSVTPDGTMLEFATFSDGDAPRGLVFAPATDETRRAGIAGDLFVVTIRKGGWPINEVTRISGPFGELPRTSGAR